MSAKADLWLLQDQLSGLVSSLYFDQRLARYVGALRSTLHELIARYDTLPHAVGLKITRQAWIATKFLSGSVSREVPYEIVNGLTWALEDWCPEERGKYVLTTTLLPDQEFYFQPVSTEFYDLVRSF